MRDYSFFGTCANDNFHTLKVIENLALQTTPPKEVILVDSGKIYKREKLEVFFRKTKIKFIYIFKDLPRIEALNLAIDKVSSKFCMRFDTRTRFSSNYAEEALKLLNNEKFKSPFVGGVPDIVPENSTYMAKICSQIMSRSYVFFYPRHRQNGYSGEASSIYLGCFKSDIIKKIKYRNNHSLISEDSLLAADYASNNYKLYISSLLKLQYVSRASFWNTLRLFNTYGYCRFNTILFSKKIHSKKRYFLILLISFIFLIGISKGFIQTVLLFPIIILVFDICGEILNNKIGRNLICPFLSVICQFSWIAGFGWAIVTCLKVKKTKTNFIQ